MALIKWNRDPFDDFDNFFNSMMMPAVRQGTQRLGLDLAVDVYEKDGSIIVEMNLPGIDPENITVDVENGYLKIAGSREEEAREVSDDQRNYYTREIRRGSFQRMVSLPDNANAETAEAEYEAGVLQVRMEKMTPDQQHPNRIQVKHKPGK